MTKILLFSDIHIHPYRPFSYDIDGMNSRLSLCLYALTEILVYANMENMPVYFLGDLLEDRKSLNPQAITDIHHTLAANKVPFHVIPGNHDYYGRLEHQHIWHMFSPYVIVEENGVHEVDGKKIATHAYPFNYSEFHKFLENTKADYLFTHVDMDVEKAGLDEHEIKVGATKGADYKNFGHVYSGHYHWRQTTGNFTYLGNPLQKDFGDYGQEKGFHVLDVQTGSVQFIPLQDTFPRFERYTVTTPGDWDAVVQHRTTRTQDYLRISYLPSLGIPKNLDITTDPVPELVRIVSKANISVNRIEKLEDLNTDPVKSFIDYKKSMGVQVPQLGYAYAHNILKEARE